jgi:hypothetical protein
MKNLLLVFAIVSAQIIGFSQTSLQWPYAFRITEREINVGNYCPGGSESTIPILAKVYSKDLVLRGLASSPLGVKFGLTPEMKDVVLPYKIPNTSLQLPYDFKIYINIPNLKEGAFSRIITISTNETKDNVHQVVVKGDYLKSRCQ